MSLDLRPGLPFPLGATARAGGVNFAVVSENAEAVELCLFDGAGRETRVALPGFEDGVWHGFLRGPEVGPGTIYGYRVHGPYAPAKGHRFNPNKLLLDPYAREIVGDFAWDERLYGYLPGHPEGHHSFDGRDSAAVMLKARVPAPPDGPVAAMGRRVPAAETILYELHVKGFSKLHPGVPEALRGTYAGLAHPACVEHLRSLGVTTVSLMPIHYALSEAHLAPLGLRNYWGYNSIGWLCPDPRLSSTPDNPAATRAEVRAMVEALHAAGLELVLDVVYNHNAEAGETGPTLSLRGLDHALYYRLDPGDRSRCLNWTGCGNTLDFDHPRVVQLCLDSLRCWVSEYGFDGFRFDLAPVLGRSRARGGAFDAHAPLFAAIAQDPVLARAKLIAEPWDVGPGGYQLGRFPGRWLEWNDRFRDDLRRFWLRRDLGRGELARRLAGSSDRFHHGQRRPSASVNFVTAHDGFTLADLVSYARKHNQANGEDNRDGHSHNFSINCGVEGPAEDPEIAARRGRLRRALIASLLLAQGTPMLLAGDELGHSQRGNNNAYCQDNAISWIDWSAADASMLAFVRACLKLRRAHPVLRRDSWLSDHWQGDAGLPVEWRRSDGQAMSVADWHDPAEGCLAVRLGEPEGDTLLLLFNAQREAVDFRLPPGPWQVGLDSARASESGPEPGASLRVAGESLMVLTRP